MTAKNLLVELLVEELPPKSLKKLSDSFAEVLVTKLKSQGLVANDVVVTAYATPRRLAVHVTNVADQAADKQVSQKLMPVTVGLDANGQPTPALLKKLFSLGVNASAVPNLKRKNDGKGDVLLVDTVVKGMDLTSCLTYALGDTLGDLPIAKEMTYQLKNGWDTVSFVRPVHGLVVLHGSEVLKAVHLLGLEAGNQTHGHRFEAKVDPIVIKDADSYETQLENEGAVIASFAKRRAEIARQLAAVAAQEGLDVIQDEALLDEVTGLVERPNVLLGQFEKEFLDVPPECLILTMKANQKYFPLIDTQGKLTHQFLIISNIRPADPSQVIKGNERVVRARLADAKFFFDKDRKRTLASRVTDLDKIVYHNKLGSQGERVQRVRAIARPLTKMLAEYYWPGQEQVHSQYIALADRAALLSKCDLLTDMVGEFPELQGIMGRYYALSDNEGVLVAEAIEDHYNPRFARDELPRTEVGICVALADKLETLVGMFGIGQVPTGDKDPFALRRQALGIIRMLIDKNLPWKLVDLIDIAFTAFPTGLLNADGGTHINVETFMLERLSGYLREKLYAGKFYTANEVAAVLSLRPSQLYVVPKRLVAVRAFAALPEAASLAAANKRVGNILKKVEGDFALRQAQGERIEVNATLLQEPAEQSLHQALNQIAPKADAAFAAGDYTGSLQALAALRAPVDAFFDNVMVNAEDLALRNNRLALLSQLQQAMNRVADISKLAS